MKLVHIPVAPVAAVTGVNTIPASINPSVRQGSFEILALTVNVTLSNEGEPNIRLLLHAFAENLSGSVVNYISN